MSLRVSAFPSSTTVRIAALTGGALAVALLAAVPVFAQQPTPSDDDVNAVARQLYCPVCENVPLDVCPTQACAQWRGTIREKLSLGWSDEQIKAYFVAQYGDRVLATPPAHGLNWLVYVLPPLVIVAAAILLGTTLRRWRQPAAAAPAATPPPEDPYARQLEDELRRRS
jgi:cytochrome c-type biogenesis protein CcmH